MMLFRPVLVSVQGVIGDISQNKFKKIEILFFPPSENWLPEQKMALKTWLPEKNMAFKYGYWNRKWPSNMVTRTKPGHQIWFPEQKMAFKYGYQNKFIFGFIEVI
jgi:hypothetical protein